MQRSILSCWVILALLIVLGGLASGTQRGVAQDGKGSSSGGSWAEDRAEMLPLPTAVLAPAKTPPPTPIPLPAPAAGDKPLLINLPTALYLSGVRPIDVALTSERVRLAAAELERAKALWLPTIYVGVDYFRHDGQIQDVAGQVFGTSKQTFMVGAAPFAVFAVTDALFAPLAARQTLRAREADVQTARNDSLLATAEAYFNVQQARGELAGAVDAARRAEEVLHRTEKLAGGGEGILAEVDVVRARTEFDRRDQTIDTARERWRTASAELARVLRLAPSALVEPLEEPHLQVTLVGLEKSVDDLIAMALTSRPELAAQQAIVQATLVRLKQERLRPLTPSVLLRGASTNPAGTLAAGEFGGGKNDDLGHFSSRSDFDVQLLWEFQNLGFGNAALVKARRAENQLAVLEVFRIQDRVAAEVAQAYAQAQSAATRAVKAERELKDAVESADKNFKGMGQTKTAGGLIVLIIRPQEVVAAVQALAQAYGDYYGTVGDYNRAQFRLYRALGQPAQVLAGQGGGPSGAPDNCHTTETMPPQPPREAPRVGAWSPDRAPGGDRRSPLAEDGDLRSARGHGQETMPQQLGQPSGEAKSAPH
jgi:outer membrane protein TolC